MRHILFYSGGKDSTATVILDYEHGRKIGKENQIEEIIFAEVMFDKKNQISGENPEHIVFIKEVVKPLFESWGYKFTIVRAEKDYLDFFNRKIERPTKYIEHKGMHFGFPYTKRCGVKRDLKVKPINDYLKIIKEPVTQYLGICIDEPKRLESMHKMPSKVSLMEQYGYTEEMARKKCLEYGLLSPAYEYSNRGGCWMCPYSKDKEKLAIKQTYPEAWQTFVELEEQENVANPVYNPHSCTLREIDQYLHITYATAGKKEAR